MTVFKNYFKIIKKYLPIIIIYTVIFSAFAVAFTQTSNSQTNFTAVKPKLLIIDKDNTVLSKTFKTYMKNYSKIIDISAGEIDDALFYREIDVVIEIPKYFTENFDSKLELKKLPDSSNALVLEQYINKYFQTVEIYKKSNIPADKINSIILEDLKVEANVSMLSGDFKKIEKVNYFFNFLNYIFLAIVISIIGIVMGSFLDENIKKRNLISKYSYKKINFELLLANAVFTIALWMVYVIMCIVLFGDLMFTNIGLLLMLNFFIFGIVCLSIGFLIGTLVKNKEAQNGITNVIALGFSFIAGSFVPQEFLGTFVLSVAKLTPSYWFIKNNNEISLISNFNIHNLCPIIFRMIILLGFAILFWTITNIISKSKREKN